ncbi:prefoldin subunit 4 [Onthophagus taurus]|uniref:prefoldin subunit 4 n=1 Tax=Onthophagus taurus TaxID=166361 RepID=UPI000C1FF0DF|nr:prefoldin subunit 4 [Onthophagus taurus]
MSTKASIKHDSDINITQEDQQKINKFARLNARWEDLKEEMKQKENDIKNLEDACEELMLLDDDENIPYLTGEVFIYQNKEATEESLEEAKQKKQEDINKLKENLGKLEETMNDLKLTLYAKFGGAINLEAES